jgi:four helix bundle protein
MPKSFRDLKVWHLSMDLTVLIYALTSEFPKHEVYGLSSQMRRAAVSISSNLAEGSSRSTKKDFRQFVIIAGGSNSELQTQLIIASRVHYATDEKSAKPRHPATKWLVCSTASHSFSTRNRPRLP